MAFSLGKHIYLGWFCNWERGCWRALKPIPGIIYCPPGPPVHLPSALLPRQSVSSAQPWAPAPWALLGALTETPWATRLEGPPVPELPPLCAGPMWPALPSPTLHMLSRTSQAFPNLPWLLRKARKDVRAKLQWLSIIKWFEVSWFILKSHANLSSYFLICLF